jgi:hypothetical protein
MSDALRNTLIALGALCAAGVTYLATSSALDMNVSLKYVNSPGCAAICAPFYAERTGDGSCLCNETKRVRPGPSPSVGP